jgi:hypothetical protein
MPVMPDATILTTGAHDPAHEAARDRSRKPGLISLPEERQGWRRRFEDPIPLPLVGRMLFTLEDAATYIMKLSKAERDLPEWQAAGEALIMAAERRGPLMHARIGMLRALNQASGSD